MAKTKKPVPKKKSRFIKLPCMTFFQENQKLVYFSANAHLLWKILEINRREEDKEKGYQRVLSPSRVRAIAKYIQSGNCIPMSILVSFDKAELLEDDSVLKVPNISKSGWVIDGQHRLAGAYESKKDYLLPVIAFINLDESEQIQQFVTINKEAKGVSASLYYDLLKYIPNKKPGEIAKERAADIAAQLKRDERSTFYGKIVITTAPRMGEISLTNFVRKVTPLILEGKGFFNTYTEREQIAIINNYYIALRNVFPREFNKQNSIFFRTIGFGGLFNALQQFFSICFRQYRGFTAENATKIFNEIKHFDFEGWQSMGTGNAAEIEAGNDLIAELTKAFENQPGKGGSLRV